MKVPINHPSFISFLESISNNILASVDIESHFRLNKEKQLALSFTIFNLLKNSAKIKANLTDTELKNFITVFCKKNEEIENYEFAAVLNNILVNFDSIINLSNTSKKLSKPPKKADRITPSQTLQSPPQL
jgi:hypothetical protein